MALKNKSKIDKLFSDESKKIYSPTIKARYFIGYPEVLVSVPIRLFKSAVDRNRVKRLMRESIRKQNNSMYTIAFIYSSDVIEDFKTIDRDISEIFNKLK